MRIMVWIGESEYDEEYKQNSSDEDWFAAVDSVEKQLNSNKKNQEKFKTNPNLI